MKSLGKALLGAVTFYASRHKNEECGINGLPLTPNSIRILGRFQTLTAFRHPNLSVYLDLVRGKHERVFVVFEHYGRNLSMHTKMELAMSAQIYLSLSTFSILYTCLYLCFRDDIIKLVHEILLALTYLNKKGLIHGCLAPKYVLFNDRGKAVLSNYGLFYMTESGTTVPFPIGHPKYTPPEVFCDEKLFKKSENKVKMITQEANISKEELLSKNPKRDAWSLGIIVLELVCRKDLWSDVNVGEIIKKILNFVNDGDKHPLEVLLEDLNSQQRFQNIPQVLQNFIRKCLNVLPSQRPSPAELLRDVLFERPESIRDRSSATENAERHDMFPTELRSRHLRTPYDDDLVSGDPEDLLSERSMREVYWLWKLAGGDVEGVFKKSGRLSRRPPVSNLLCFVGADGEMLGSILDSSTLFDDTVVVLSQQQLRQRLRELDEKAYYLLLEFNDFSNSNESNEKANQMLSTRSSYDIAETMSLPLVIRENDVEYQFHRMVLFDRLLTGYPYKKQQILKECRVDIPPIFRARLWAALLEVQGDVVGAYEAIDKESPSATDRQIEVDIPRCHQYNPLLSSPTGHLKFKRLLKAWVAGHPEYVYWQGLDSLCAPFLYLNFNDEATAFACLCAFIPKYLHNFFLKDNAPVIREYLAVFSHLIAFQDPVLFTHLDSIGFIPDLYSIPWFLTMYAHVFPLHKIFHLWDTLMLGNSSFPLCIGVAILKQLRDQLLMFSFNECILLFSDMPEIDIEKCVQDSIQIFRSTPKSITFRHHAGKPSNQKSAPRPPVASFYSRDSYNIPKTHLSIDRISLEELRSEKCARISAEELIELSGLQGSVVNPSPKKNKQNSKSDVAVVDIRLNSEFLTGSFPGSVNLPRTEAFAQDGRVASSDVSDLLLQHKNAVKVVLGGSSVGEDLEIAEKLVQLGYSKVCTLHKGIDLIKTEGLLTVSS